MNRFLKVNKLKSKHFEYQVRIYRNAGFSGNFIVQLIVLYIQVCYHHRQRQKNIITFLVWQAWLVLCREKNCQVQHLQMGFYTGKKNHAFTHRQVLQFLPFIVSYLINVISRLTVMQHMRLSFKAQWICKKNCLTKLKQNAQQCALKEWTPTTIDFKIDSYWRIGIDSFVLMQLRGRVCCLIESSDSSH